ncbi:hypothetical protein AVEN_102912-1 [Araneus ventricosus]|uniref:Uncharacterized protein n=1 Tax=Araneus ventricosus TaxID=182803 RepID=A0A4Y2HZM6_ARAVE|nr:hypothetical protein AVEN_102912-1 [Araneus ventricosus]
MLFDAIYFILDRFLFQFFFNLLQLGLRESDGSNRGNVSLRITRLSGRIFYGVGGRDSCKLFRSFVIEELFGMRSVGIRRFIKFASFIGIFAACRESKSPSSLNFDSWLSFASFEWLAGTLGMLLEPL